MDDFTGETNTVTSSPGMEGICPRKYEYCLYEEEKLWIVRILKKRGFQRNSINFD